MILTGTGVCLKIIVVASPDNADVALKVMLRLETEGHETLGLKFSQNWRLEPKSRLERLFQGASHLLCLVDAKDTASSWLAYLVGLARGKEMPLYFHGLGVDGQSEPWIVDLPWFADLDKLVANYAHEALEWTASEARRVAKASLLELGISWHAESLAQCAREGDTKAVELFIESGFPPDARDKSGVPLLCIAARTRHRNVVELLLDKGAHIDAKSDDRGYSALMDSTQQGDESLVRLLLDRGADTDVQSKDGQTSLVLAVGRNDATLVRVLLDRGANPEISDKLGLTARKYAKLFHNPDVISAFEDYDRDRSS